MTLNKCKCCGGKASLESLYQGGFYCVCEKDEECGVMGPNRASREEAIAAWNLLMSAPVKLAASAPRIVQLFTSPDFDTAALCDDGSIWVLSYSTRKVSRVNYVFPRPAEVVGEVE